MSEANQERGSFMGRRERFFHEIMSLNPEVTGSCHQVVVHFPDGRATNFVVDCGQYQEEAYNYRNKEKFPFDPEKIEFVLITHNHADHMGRLSQLVKEGFKGKIYVTTETEKLIITALRDAFKIMKEDTKKHNEKMLYSENDLEETISRITPCDFNETNYIDRNIKVIFLMNGHMLGASMIRVQISYPGEEDMCISFTGDYKPNNIFFEVEEIPQWIYDEPTEIVVESTYGYMNSTEVKYHMEDDIENATKAGKTILMPVFAQERAQGMLFMLKCMQNTGKISKRIPIRLDGSLAQEYTKLYMASELLKKFNKNDFLPENFEFISKENREMILANEDQQIILTTSGMMDHGPAQIYLERYVERRDVLIYVPGYTAPDTLGYKLQHPNSKNQVVINGKEYYINAQVLTTNEASGHAKADELIALLQRFKNPILIFVNHGRKDVLQLFAQRVEKEVTAAKRVEILGEHTFVCNHYGYVKHMGSKLFKAMTKNEKLRKKEKKKKCFVKKPRSMQKSYHNYSSRF